MNLFVCALLLFLLHTSDSEDCVIDNRSRKTAWEQQLRKDLILCSDRYEPPDINNTEVFLKLMLKSFYFDSKEEILSINTWLPIFWRDPRLAWKPEEYDGITEVLLPSMLIWTPKLKLFNAVGTASFDEIDFYVNHCRIHNDGSVACIPRILHQSVCSTKLKDWPYDTQNCTFKFGTRSKRERVTFTLNSSRPADDAVVLAAEYGPGWNIIDQTSGEDPNATVQFYFTFVLKRHGVGLAAVVVAPPLVLSALILTSMLMNVDDGIRLALLCFSLLSQLFFLQEISSDIPKNGADTPTVLFYLRSTIILTLMAIGITFILRHLKRKSSPPPIIIMVSTEKIYNSHGKCLIWPRMDGFAKDWSGIAHDREEWKKWKEAFTQ
ncbi:unnamed protein product, partial [Iphiclides podalirius]